MQHPADRKQGIHSHQAQWATYAVAWSMRNDKKNRLAIGSFLEDYNNKVEIVDFNIETGTFTVDTRLAFEHPYAPTNLHFFPSADTIHPDILATSGDHLRLWHISDDKTEMKALLNYGNYKGGNSSGAIATTDPSNSSSITSFDWSEIDLQKIATSSVDTTCTIWDVEKEVVDTQLVAHDKEVYDVSWGGPGIFGSVSGDGSVRIFDLRDKERSTIIYENSFAGNVNPLLRIEWNKANPKFISTFGMDSTVVVVIDIRFPTTPLLELKKHKGSVNGISWSPDCDGRYLCSVSDDSRVLIWDVAAGLEARPTSMCIDDGTGGHGNDLVPAVWYGTSSEINNVRWSASELDWIAITFLNKLQLLRVN